MKYCTIFGDEFINDSIEYDLRDAIKEIIADGADTFFYITDGDISKCIAYVFWALLPDHDDINLYGISTNYISAKKYNPLPETIHTINDRWSVLLEASDFFEHTKTPDQTVKSYHTVKYLIDISEYIICFAAEDPEKIYFSDTNQQAYKLLKYAKAQNKKIINIRK